MNSMLCDPARIAKAFNEWMKRYIEQPAQFAREWQTVAEFLEQSKDGKTPTYGEVSTEYLHRLIIEDWRASEVTA